MHSPEDELNRIEKLLVDRDGISPSEARAVLSQTKVCLYLDESVERSEGLQAAVLTAAVTAVRCFPGAVSFVTQQPSPPLRVRWPDDDLDLSSALRTLGVTERGEADSDAHVVVFGNERTIARGVRVSFSGWVAHISPADQQHGLDQREGCVVAGIAAGALAISEIFLAANEISTDAGRREVALSMWRPDLPWDASESIGPRVEYLPSELRLLGLGHLGQAYAWCLSFLPFEDPLSVRLMINDFERLVPANVGTGVLSEHANVGQRKTAVVSQWLVRRGFDPAIVDSPFQANYRWMEPDPRIALCGFDGQGPRFCLDDTNFVYVGEAGLGGRVDNFDTIAFHSFPNGLKKASEIWTRDSGDSSETAKAIASRNTYYRDFARHHRCGHLQLAGKSVAVPFVGAIAGALVFADLLRILHGGRQFASASLRLASPDDMKFHSVNSGATPRIPFIPAV